MATRRSKVAAAFTNSALLARGDRIGFRSFFCSPNSKPAERFIEGIATVSLVPSVRSYLQFIAPSSESAIADDWRMVGQDLDWSIREFHGELEKHGRFATPEATEDVADLITA